MPPSLLKKKKKKKMKAGDKKEEAAMALSAVSVPEILPRLGRLLAWIISPHHWSVSAPNDIVSRSILTVPHA